VQPDHDPAHVTFHDRLSLVECDAGNGARRVSSNPWQIKKVFKFGREFAPVLVQNHACGALQVSSPAVVSQPSPSRQDGGFGRFGQGPNIGKLPQEALIVGKNGPNLGLLQHDLGNPDPVGRRMGAPRKLALMMLIPVQEQVLKLMHLVAIPGFWFHAPQRREVAKVPWVTI
jgi:hypothetical protein